MNWHTVDTLSAITEAMKQEDWKLAATLTAAALTEARQAEAEYEEWAERHELAAAAWQMNGAELAGEEIPF